VNQLEPLALGKLRGLGGDLGVRVAAAGHTDGGCVTLTSLVAQSTVSFGRPSAGTSMMYHAEYITSDISEETWAQNINTISDYHICWLLCVHEFCVRGVSSPIPGYELPRYGFGITRDRKSCCLIKIASLSVRYIINIVIFRGISEEIYPSVYTSPSRRIECQSTTCVQERWQGFPPGCRRSLERRQAPGCLR
jgi:hypothetical protein